MEDRVIVEQIMLATAREIAQERNEEPDYEPWGGMFSKDKPREVHAAGMVGQS